MAMSKNAQGQTMYEAIASLITPNGIKQRAVFEKFEKLHGKMWNPTSAAPALTYLERVGIIKREGPRGERRVLKLVRRYDPKRDDEAISAAMSERHDTAPKAKGNGAIPFTSTKFMVAVGQKDTVVLDGKQAYALWKELNQIFGGRS